MTPPVALTLIGVGVGVLLLTDARGKRAPAMVLRERALRAQELSARASQYARDLAAQWSAEQDRLTAGGRR